MSGIKKYMMEDAYLNDMEKAYELVDEDDYEYYDDSFDDYDDSFDYPEVENNIEQFYGVDGNGTPKYVAMSKEQVQKFAKAHPEEDIVRVESSSGMRFNLYEALKAFDKKHFRENASSCELEMLYESARDTLSAQQKNDLAKFVRKARTAEEINTYMTGMLAKAANESLKESSHFEYGDAMSKANQAKDIIDSAKDKDGKEVCVGSSVIVPQSVGYSDRQADVEDIFINKHNVEMLRVKYNDSKTENVAAKCCTLVESLSEDVDEATFNKLKQIAYELDEYIEDKVWVRDFWYDAQFDNTISFEIYGDWKHDHARFRYYASEWLDNKGLRYKMWETITDDDGSDSYGATHTIRLYDIEESTVEEGYISQSTSQEQSEVEPDKFSNGRLRDFDPYPFMKKIMNSGKSMNSIRTLGDDYYTIFVSYMNHFGPKGIDDKDTKYSLDIIKEIPNGEQTRELYERNLLWSDVAEKLSDWRQDKVTENPLAESVSSNLNKINNSVYAADALTIVLNNLSDKLDGYDEFSDGDFEVSYQGSKKELQREIIDAFADAGITLGKERNALTYSIPNNYDAYIYISKDDDASTYTENSIGYYIKAETVL